ncbi:MAG: hypothetical protein GX548_05070 [Lentisphaerae bacterium]|nr:hypothetical protein [Lentisphaerota bacterium]
MRGTGHFRRGTIAGVFALAAALAGAQSPPAGLSPGRPGRTPITSADRRFMVSGLTSAENMVLAQQLSELATAIEEKTGIPLPMRRDQVLGVMVQSASSPDTQVLKMQGWDDARFYQRLVVPGRARLDGEDLLEGAAWLLLNRYAAEYTPHARRSGIGATVPEWISAGLVQNTRAALRSRNRDWIARELAEGRHLSLAQVVKQDTLPPGRWREKAYAAAAVDFLFPGGDLQVWAAVFQAVGQSQALDPAWLRRNIPALDGRNPEAAWREHLAGQSRARTIEAWSDQGLQLEERLLQTLNFRPRDLVAGVPADVPPDLFARDLIGYRGQEWVVPLTAALSLQVKSLQLGAPPLLKDVLASYAAYFDLFSSPPEEKTPWWRWSRRDPRKIRPPDDATWQVALNQLWQRAERAHQQFLERHQTRKRYLDRFDRTEPGSFDEPPATRLDVPRTRWQRHVDEVEVRRSLQAF